jgi:HD-GYP domain-containing protein (c-di-GMP phosphodiesterase class II)
MKPKKSIHRMLIVRLAVAASIIAALIALAAVFAALNEIDETAVERAFTAAAQFKGYIIDQLDAPGLGDHTKIRQALARATSSPPAHLFTGNFVLARILDTHFNEVAKAADTGYAHISAVMRYAERPIGRFALDHGSWYHMTRINGTTVVRVIFPLTNSANAVAAYGDMIFAVSKEALKEARWLVMRTTAAAIGIVVITTLMLYPVIMRLLRRMENLSAELLDANLQTLGVLGSAIAKRDSDTDTHNYRVAMYSVRLAESVGLDDGSIRSLIKGAFLHDVGKIGVSDAILLKEGKLTDPESSEMKRHVIYGLEIIGGSPWLKDAAPIVGGHHENYDGSGYGRSLLGRDIPVIARIFTIADVFDALTSRRPYKEPFAYEQVVEILRESRGHRFDPELLDAFLLLARPLYDEYANRDDDKPRNDLQELVQRYFKAGVASFLE